MGLTKTQLRKCVSSSEGKSPCRHKSQGGKGNKKKIRRERFTKERRKKISSSKPEESTGLYIGADKRKRGEVRTGRDPLHGGRPAFPES